MTERERESCFALVVSYLRFTLCMMGKVCVNEMEEMRKQLAFGVHSSESVK